MRTLWIALSLGALLCAPLQAKTSTPTDTLKEVTSCYAQAGNKVRKQLDCLDRELRVVKAEHKETAERVITVARERDKALKTRAGWDGFVRATQSFEGYVRRECANVKLLTRGSRDAKEKAHLACQIGLYRLRTQQLENRYLLERAY